MHPVTQNSLACRPRFRGCGARQGACSGRSAVLIQLRLLFPSVQGTVDVWTYACVVDSGAQRRVLSLGCTGCGILPCAVGGGHFRVSRSCGSRLGLWLDPESMHSDKYRKFSGGQTTAVMAILCLSSTRKTGVLSLGTRFILPQRRARPVEVR
jgi:hypothetical protein